ncbi:MAG: YaiI/YqxD family protein [Polyangia bacterium]
MKIWIDGDAMPGEIKEILLRAAQRLEVPAILVANKNVHVGSGSFVSFVRVTKGADVADAYIVETSAAGDFCITADIPLAAALVAKGLTVIDPRGDLYSEETVGERLAMRDFMAGLRESGVQTGGPRSFDAKAKQKFAARFDHLITKALRDSTR